MPAVVSTEDMGALRASGDKGALTRLGSDDSASTRSSSGQSAQRSSQAPRNSQSVRETGSEKGKVGMASGRAELGEHYPDGGWGWVVLAAATLVQVLCNGFHYSYGQLYPHIRRLVDTDVIDIAWLGSLGIGISFFISPFITIICRRKSPRLYAVIGGLISALGCLFLAFSTQPEHLFISHCVVMSLGSGITIATANIMVGRYFRRKRELAEMVLVAGTGIGTALMSFLFRELISNMRWMHGLQCVSGLLVLTIIAGVLYRPASLYHPRRKVILHLKSQKKSRRDRDAEKPPYLDFSALRMRSLQVLMVIAAIVGIGIHIPIICLVRTASKYYSDDHKLLLLNVYLGCGWVLGCLGLGYITIRNSLDCSISRRHLCQSCVLLAGLFTLLLVMAEDHRAHALYAWGYGICIGGYCYSLKLYAYELVKARLMERAWSFLTAVQCFPFLLGAPVATYLRQASAGHSESPGYILAGSAMLLGGLLFYAMPFFERHPSNQDVLQKQTSACPHARVAECAALLDLDLSEGQGGGVKDGTGSLPGCGLQQNAGGRGRQSSRGADGVAGSRGGLSGPQSACYLAHKGDKPASAAKQATLSKIAEERDAGMMAGMGSSGGLGGLGGGRGGDGGAEADGPSDSTFSNHTSSGSGSRDTHSHKSGESKKAKKGEVRVDLFDPPSQEKESTATVSYDSDLYINLCEAQV